MTEEDENIEAFLELIPVYPDGTPATDPDNFCLEEFQMDEGSLDENAKKAKELAEKIGGFVWTVIAVDNVVVLSKGIHFVNREGYVVTTLPSNLDEIVIWVFEENEDCEED